MLEDVIYSSALPNLIRAIEQQAERSQRFRAWLVLSEAVIGGRGGPEMERIFAIIDRYRSEFRAARQTEEGSEEFWFPAPRSVDD